MPLSLPRVTLLSLALLALAIPGAAHAQTEPAASEATEGAKEAGKPRRGLRALLDKAGDKVREEAMKRFDKDGDGKLDDAERAEALETLKKKGADVQAQFRQFLMRRFDADKDGTLDETERQTALDEVMKQLEQNGPMVKSTVLGMVKSRFDADGDGTLSEAELTTAREELTKRLLQAAANVAAKPAAPVDPETRRKQADEARKKEMLERFDADGDGTLSGDEREKAKEAIKKLYDEFDAKLPAPAAK